MKKNEKSAKTAFFLSYRQQAVSVEQHELVKKDTFLFNNENIPVLNKKRHFP